ncbi:MAG: radical SAM protein [Deltaproteobacteria bacterium]|nr:radical SAM protein [Deltaproteobacteria bacterium]
MEAYGYTESLSSKTGERVKAKIIKDSSGIYLVKESEEESGEKGLLERNEWFFNRTRQCLLEEQFPLNDIYIYVTSKCNLSCPVCFEDQTPSGEDISLENIKMLINQYKGKKIILSGREPTCRGDLPEIIKIASKKSRTVLLTNGIRLAEPGYAENLKRSGLARVVFSFNGFNDRIYEQMNGAPLLEKKLNGLENLKKAGLPTMLNMTLARGVNDDQMADMVRYCMDNRSFIYQLRIRSMTELGRSLEGRNQYVVSEIADVLANSLGARLDDFINERKILEKASNLFGFSMRTEKLCSIKFHIKGKRNPKPVAFGLVEDKIEKSRFKRIATFIQMVKCFGILQIVEYLPFMSKLFKPRFLTSVLGVEIRSWPNVSNIDLKENFKCPTGLFRDGDVQPFCLANVKRELMVKTEI